jgi:predicted polyphosphate/ATP-dependent NAD kinase
MKKLGFIINPIAGMGGRVGLKGTDGEEILKKAISLGALKGAPKNGLKALKKLLPIKDDIVVLTASGDMGENQCIECGLNHKVIYKVDSDKSHSSDTLNLAKLIEKEAADLILFVGGDGTARDVFTAIEDRVVALGVPAGVKIHSPVYGNTPESAGELALEYLSEKKLDTMDEEVIDIDEEAFRDNRVLTQLFGYLKIPYDKKMLQNKKAPTPLGEKESQVAIALDIVDHMESDYFYIIGPGTTTRVIMEELQLPNTLLGMDIIKNKKLIKADCSEREILEIIKDAPTKLVLTPTGGQGYLLGRGNQQISPAVIKAVKKENIVVVSTNSKIIELRGRPLRVYTGESEVDKYLEGYFRVKTGYGNDVMYKVSY